MNWKAEWDELLIVENILVRYRNLKDHEQQLDFLHNQKKNKSGKLSRIFYNLWECHIKGKDQCEWKELHKDIYLAHRIIQRGASWNLSQWEYLDWTIQDKEPFHTVWGETFYGILHSKIRIEKKAEKKAERKKERKKIRKQKQKDKRSKGASGTTIAAAVLGLVSLAFLSIWLYQTIRSDQSRYRLEDEIALMHEAQNNFGRLESDKRIVSGVAKNTKDTVISGDSIFSSDKVAFSGRAVSGQAVAAKGNETASGAAIKKKKWEVLEIYQPFLEKHSTLYGWLRVEGTSIDLPVMRPSKKMEADYYLNHSYEHQENTEGSLFVDRECKLKPRSQNIVVYGHNMRNGEMFGALVQYENPDFLSDHREITFDTIYEQGTYEVLAVLLTRVLNENEQGFRYYQIFDFKKAQDYDNCQQFINQNLAYGDPVELQSGDELLMLSTCEYSQENGRLVVVAKRKNS